MKKYTGWMICVSLMLLITLVGSVQLFSYAKAHMTTATKDPILFGATYMTMNNPFYEVIDQELRNVVEANGDILITRDPQLSLERQIQEIREMIEEGIQILIVNPVDSKGLVEVLMEAKQQGIFIIAIDTNVYQGDDFIDYTIVSDNYQAGVLCARHVMEKKEQANIIILEHAAAYSAVERIQGFKDTIAYNDAYHIVKKLECEGQLEISMPLIGEEIKQGTNFDVVMSLNDPSALGVVAALQEANKLTDVMVLGVDGTPEAKVLIKNGYMEGSVAQYPKQMAKKAIESAYALLQGESFKQEERIPVNLIDATNIDAYSLEGWQ